MVDFAGLAAAKAEGALVEGLRPSPEPAVSEPPDFRQFLQQVGSGALKDESLSIYSETIEPRDVFGPDWRGPRVRLFSDDMAGTCFGFLGPAGEIVALDANGHLVGVVAANFTAFIHTRLGL